MRHKCEYIKNPVDKMFLQVSTINAQIEQKITKRKVKQFEFQVNWEESEKKKSEISLLPF